MLVLNVFLNVAGKAIPTVIFIQWEPTDLISSAAYDSYYEFIYNAELNQMELLDKTYDFILYDENIDDHVESSGTDDLHPSRCMRFTDYQEKTADHVPRWVNNECQTCGYKFDDSRFPELEKLFSPVYFRN